MSGPFTAANLRPILGDVLKQGTTPGAGDLEALAKHLNLIHGAFALNKRLWEKSNTAADKVSAALAVLMEFFDGRSEACRAGRPSIEIVESERWLRDRFCRFVQAMEAHDFRLDADAVLLAPRLDCWRDLAVAIAGAFKAAMARNNSTRRLGLSNDGPVPRFVAAVAPMMTGEHPSVQYVGTHLKRRARERRAAETGTNDE